MITEKELGILERKTAERINTMFREEIEEMAREIAYRLILERDLDLTPSERLDVVSRIANTIEVTAP